MTKGEKLVGVVPPSEEGATVTAAEAAVVTEGATDLALSCFKNSAALVTFEFVSLRPQ